MVDRRTFLTALSQFVAAGWLISDGRADESQTRSDRLGDWMPARPMGRTGEPLTMLCLGGYHFGAATEEEAQALLEAALEEGVRFIDSAVQYQNGGCEERMGRLITPQYRDVVFLTTKSGAKNAEDAEKELEDSLRRMNTEYLDLWQIHAIDSAEDVDERIENGVLDVFLKAKESGKARYIGFTGHRDYRAHLRMLERTDDIDPFDACQMPINVLDPGYASFSENVLPKLVERNIGVLAMKTLAFGSMLNHERETDEGEIERVIPDRITLKDALQFVWSLPISSLVSGMENVSQVRENAGAAKTWAPIDQERMDEMIALAADFSGRELESYKS